MTISLQISKFYTYAYKTKESHLELNSQYSRHIQYIQENSERPADFDKKKIYIFQNVCMIQCYYIKRFFFLMKWCVKYLFGFFCSSKLIIFLIIAKNLLMCCILLHAFTALIDNYLSTL